MLVGKKYDEEVDWWSIGVILYVLLCGYPPFESDNEVDLRNEILNIGVKFDSADWENVSEEARDLVKKLLVIDQSQRIKVEEIINHPWMLGNADNNHLTTVQDNIKKFKSKLRQVRNAIRAVRIMQSLKMGH
jgi:serine/threonine protein kinase